MSISHRHKYTPIKISLTNRGENMALNFHIRFYQYEVLSIIEWRKMIIEGNALLRVYERKEKKLYLGPTQSSRNSTETIRKDSRLITTISF